jgi:hypothetical protein
MFGGLLGKRPFKTVLHHPVWLVSPEMQTAQNTLANKGDYASLSAT